MYSSVYSQIYRKLRRYKKCALLYSDTGKKTAEMFISIISQKGSQGAQSQWLNTVYIMKGNCMCTGLGSNPGATE